MKIFPYYKMVIKHSKTADEIYNVMSNQVEPCKLFGSRTSTKLFCGTCNKESFTLRRIIQYRNSFLPIIHGEIHSKEVIITMKMHEAITILVAVWLIGASMGSLFTIFAIFFSPFRWDYLIALSILPLGFLLIYFGFWKEVKIAEKELRKLIN